MQLFQPPSGCMRHQKMALLPSEQLRGSNGNPSPWFPRPIVCWSLQTRWQTASIKPNLNELFHSEWYLLLARNLIVFTSEQHRDLRLFWLYRLSLHSWENTCLWVCQFVPKPLSRVSVVSVPNHTWRAMLPKDLYWSCQGDAALPCTRFFSFLLTFP